VAGQYLTKGKQIYVEGRLQTRSWEDRQSGERRYKTEVICENFQMLSSRGDGDSYRQSAPEPELPGGEPEDDDIPF
jgi:single-strand DNA-binding protein